MKEAGNIYTRLTNPTVKIFEEKIALLENGESAIATASGMSAIFFTILNVARLGDNIIVAKQVYGGTSTLTEHTLKDFGIVTYTFDVNKPNEIKELITDKTKLILFETISNPTTTIANFYKIISIANKFNILTCADNTLATPILIKPLSIGNSLSIITHPASTTHSQIKQSDLKKYGITPSLLRLSIGLESPIDLINSLKEVLK